MARSTFYVYYQNIDELAEDVENYHIFNLTYLNNYLLNPEIKVDRYALYYKETIDYIQEHKNTFYAFLIANINNRFISKWKDAIKHHLLERNYRWSNTSNCQLILEMVASEVIAAHTFCMINPYEVDVNNLDKIVTQTLKSIEF